MHPWDGTGIGQWALAGSRLSSKAQGGEKSVCQQMSWLEARSLSLARVACHACLSSLTDANNSYLECRGLIGSLSIFNALILWSIKSGLTFEGRASRPSRKNNQDWQGISQFWQDRKYWSSWEGQNVGLSENWCILYICCSINSEEHLTILVVKQEGRPQTLGAQSSLLDHWTKASLKHSMQKGQRFMVPTSSLLRWPWIFPVVFVNSQTSFLGVCFSSRSSSYSFLPKHMPSWVSDKCNVLGPCSTFSDVWEAMSGWHLI